MLLEPKRAMRIRFWRRIGAAVVRWPGSDPDRDAMLCLIGLIALPGYQHRATTTGITCRRTCRPAEGITAAERHFPAARLSPELLMIESDHDLRNSADFLVIDRVAKSMFHQPGIGRVQTITRPLGTPIEHSSIPFMLGMNGTTQTMNQSYLQDRMKDMLKMGDDMNVSIDTMTQMYNLMGELNAVTHDMVGKMDLTLADIQTLRNHIADFDDFFRPIRNYFYWEPHCFDIPVCWSIRSVFDTLDGIDTMTDDFQQLVPQPAPAGHADRPDAHADAADDRDDALDAHDAADHAEHPVRHVRPDRGHAGQPERDGQGVRRRQERRLVLPAARGVRQPRLQARHEDVPVAGRKSGAVHHLPRG